jgi:15-cis-phytoene synthase
MMGSVRVDQRGRRERAEVVGLEEGLASAWESLDLGSSEGVPVRGQLLRPKLAASVADPRWTCDPGGPFWFAVLAIQLAHEASLLHDDVVDGSTLRRNAPTEVRRRGIGAALVAGDQLLARAYMAAARTESWAFIHRFTVAIDRTIEGERLQGEAAGQRLDRDEMTRILRGKSGELFGCALSVGATLAKDPEAEATAELGRSVGVLYQRVDDLLDYCPGAGTGKKPFADFSRDLWTWPRLHLPEGAPPEAFFQPAPEGVPALRALEELEEEGWSLLHRVQVELAEAETLSKTIRAWLDRAAEAIRGEVGSRSGSRTSPPHLRDREAFDGAASVPEDSGSVLAEHGRSFHAATRLMPPEVRGSVARVYSFCRTLDDAVDRASSAQEAERRLAELLDGARAAYFEGIPSEGAPSDAMRQVMGEMREADVSFEVVELLCEGLRMDLRPRGYADLDELRVYTHRVAGVVGHWIAGLAGCRDPWALKMAAELGHAMQLTNIARDVGEDLGMGRIYLPADLLRRHELDAAELQRIAASKEAVPHRFAAALEELMGWADAGYGAAFQAIPHLPPQYRRAVAAAARIYQGIHDGIRRNGYDSLRLRAHTGRLEKTLLGFSSLRELARVEARAGRPSEE